VLRAEGYQATDTPGEKSQFDVLVDGRLVFSKQREGRFPESDEILGTLRT
jgi:predicted Rdx family selenoprotein